MVQNRYGHERCHRGNIKRYIIGGDNTYIHIDDAKVIPHDGK